MQSSIVRFDPSQVFTVSTSSSAADSNLFVAELVMSMMFFLFALRLNLNSPRWAIHTGFMYACLPIYIFVSVITTYCYKNAIPTDDYLGRFIGPSIMYEIHKKYLLIYMASLACHYCELILPHYVVHTAYVLTTLSCVYSNRHPIGIKHHTSFIVMILLYFNLCDFDANVVSLLPAFTIGLTLLTWYCIVPMNISKQSKMYGILFSLMFFVTFLSIGRYVENACFAIAQQRIVERQLQGVFGYLRRFSFSAAESVEQDSIVS